ncbi:MAG: JAB domain-containing protein [Anaerolineae bacterium]
MAEKPVTRPVPTLRDVTPSREDVRVTKTLVEAGRILEVELLDHIIVGRDSYASLKERGLGF